MRKVYIITAVDHGDTCDGKARTLGVFFDRNEALKVLQADIEDYKAMHPTYGEGKLSVTDEDGNGCEWNIEEADIRLPLTPMQIVNLNGFAQAISLNPKSYADYEDLSDEERAYLIDNLKHTYGIDVTNGGEK